MWRLHRFALISGTGWLMDLSIMSGLVYVGFAPLIANCISASTAVTFVFVMAQKRTFVTEGSIRIGKLSLYAAFNIFIIFLASTAVAALSHVLSEPVSQMLSSVEGQLHVRVSRTVAASLVAKIMVTPFTLYANFIFMSWLLEGRVSWR